MGFCLPFFFESARSWELGSGGIINYELWIINYELWIGEWGNYELWIMNWGVGEREVGSGGDGIINIVISIKIENINPRVHKGFVGLECIRLIWNDYKSWILNSDSWILTPEYSILNTEYWILPSLKPIPWCCYSQIGPAAIISWEAVVNWRKFSTKRWANSRACRS